MRKLFLLIGTCFIFNSINAQDTYTVNGQNIELKTEIEGKLDLLWNIISDEYRYFVRTEDGNLTELTNTKGKDNKYKQEYKSTLSNLTKGMDTKRLKLTLYDLRAFIDAYNVTVDTAYNSVATERQLGFRLGFSGGITNNPFTSNTDNTKTPLAGAELEVFEANTMPRHSGFLQLRHAFENDDFQYNTTEFSLGYRYRIINKSSFSIYGQAKVATLNFTKATVTGSNNSDLDISESSFDIPFIFGIGSDIKVGKNSFITIIYSELFAVFLDNQGNFSTDISIGYKFNL